MAIHPIDYRYGSEEMKRIWEEENKLQKLLDVEAALARAHAKVGNIPEESARAISEKANTKWVKVERVKEIEAEIHHDIMAVVKALSEVCGEHGKYVHLGATSNDIIDTANALLIKESLEIVLKDLRELRSILKNLAKEHKYTVCIGRTHGQHAVPTTYGMKFAIWLDEIQRHIDRIEEAKKRILVGQMSGAVGTMASFGEKGLEIQRLVMEDLGLKPALITNQIIQRDVYGELMSILALIASTLDKIALEIRNLQRTEILEISEPFGKKQVGSSTMPHKRNPIRCEKVSGLARVIYSNVIPALLNNPLWHERDLTNSSVERVILPETFILLDEMLKSMKKVLSGLEFFPENIKRNLYLTKNLIMAEPLMLKLTEKGMGRQEAHELVRQLAMKAFEEGRDLLEVVKESEAMKYLSEEDLESLRPENYIGLAPQIVDNVIAYIEEVERREGG
ncbi:MAG: adenylosuccinate lyase [Thermococcaceae archaeon]|jgi:adenylosuccinate lyase|uniref:adenylosuccinate lyase n=1 Tax=Thermococcus bergensis TaxID=2689387 RepID=UPI001CEC4BEB|nr:adenylosuccinate lyase [Thermococcus bergensis]MDK2783428.1 adenylosuccinate lyase [Thermococcaceae archaeon]MCA6214895.1 adenylosuccinate lyase [Thermococcus bergensis]MDK2853342.1 adenylosuccinate lyase [Thermococcaceae archaeon]MDK2983820.1 adenylosuccinate lyase [Thermococcaceae archaeon]MDN5320285.1 adenylosuccinate lyase [Thermococcaceae archaeon]